MLPGKKGFWKMRNHGNQGVAEALQHTSCLNCGKLIFDKLLDRCPKCGGHVVYLSDDDLGLLGRHVLKPQAAPAEEE